VIPFIKRASTAMLMAYFFAYREGRWDDRRKFRDIVIELNRRAKGCFIVYKEKREW